MPAFVELYLEGYNQNGISQVCYIVKIYHSGLEPLIWNWLAHCQYTVTGWNSKFDLLFESYNGCAYNWYTKSYLRYNAGPSSIQQPENNNSCKERGQR